MLKLLITSLAISGFAAEHDVAKVSEAMGHIIGKNLDALGLDLDLNAIVKGLKEEAEGKKSPLNEDECVQAISILQEEKMVTLSETQLEQIDALSNGDQIHDDEHHTFPAPDSAKYR